ncbi:RPKL1 protein, partial [Heliornis fulica]|nr:RPKL1 protein [Heliornis fulica]
VDPNKERREAVKRKITQYLRRAEEIFNCHLQRAAGGGNPTTTGYSSLRFRPIRTLSSAVENLRRCKVVGVIDKVQIVQDVATGGTFILKSLPKSHVETRERQTIIPHGVPFMVKLLCYYVSEDSIFLHLEHVQGSGNHCRLRPTPTGDTRATAGLQDLSVTPAMSGVVDHIAAASAKGPGHLTKQGLVIYPWDTLTSISARGCILERAAPQDPRLCAHQRLPQILGPVLKTARGDQPGVGVPPSQEASEVPWALTPLTSLGQRPLRPGVALPRSVKAHGPDPTVQEPSQGASVTCGQLREQRPSGQCWSVASWGHGWRAWAVKEEQVQLWAAEILLALEGLHQQGLLCRDLNPRNLLLDAAGHVRLTFFSQWTEVEPQCCSQAQEELYSAPEVGGITEPTEAADCWSFGSLLYELLTGVPLSQNHPSGIQPHTQLYLPEGLSLAAKLLLTELLQYDPKRRLGAGGGGVAKLKSHSFFSTIPWNNLVG